MTKIYLDLDGVFADFHSGVQMYTDVDNYADNPSEVWKKLETIPHYFRDLTVLQDSPKILNRILEVVPPQYCEFLTALPKITGHLYSAQRDKVEWVRAQLNSHLQVNCVAHWSLKKYFCRSPHDILIDDSQRNIDEWTAVGGTGILHRDVKTTLEELDNYLC